MSRSPQTLNVTEQHQLLDALIPKSATNAQHRKGIRNYCIALLMLEAGLRVGEVVRLLQTDLLKGNQPVKAVFIDPQISKNKTERLIPLSTRVQKSIEEMRKTWWIYHDDDPAHYAFYNTDPFTHITERQVQRIIETVSEESIGRAIHPHVLRHTFASKLMRITNIRVVQNLLGHRQLASTQVYTHPNQDDLTKAIQSLDQQ